MATNGTAKIGQISHTSITTRHCGLWATRHAAILFLCPLNPVLGLAFTVSHAAQQQQRVYIYATCHSVVTSLARLLVELLR